jgi:hypothetical protein
MVRDTPFSYPLQGTKIESELEILRALVAGRNPVTGALLPENSFYHSVKVIRALLAAIRILEKRAQQTKSDGKPSDNPFGLFQGRDFSRRSAASGWIE